MASPYLASLHDLAVTGRETLSNTGKHVMETANQTRDVLLDSLQERLATTLATTAEAIFTAQGMSENEPGERLDAILLTMHRTATGRLHLPHEPTPFLCFRSKECKRYLFDLRLLVATQLRRYMMDRCAIELFFESGESALVAVPAQRGRPAGKRKPIDVLYQWMASNKLVRIDIPRKAPSTWSGLRDLTHRWCRRDISNFEYLMKLNSIAGRTLNDLTQYPVMPWILADYTSSKLDFTNAATFRDLSKPMGAQLSDRAAAAQERFQQLRDIAMAEMDAPLPPFMWGSHYSTSAGTLYYLIRLHPFTQLAIDLQGGGFDHSSRLFYGIHDSWQSACVGPSDCKELTPEFFFLADFLRNQNHLPLGERTDGSAVGDVKLPNWASTPEEFVRIHREALESEFVSARLHLWIDLIFGYKQRGPDAVSACNVFHYASYEGSVDIATIEDELQQQALADQIENFGQCPMQLFRRPHPQRHAAVAEAAADAGVYAKSGSFVSLLDARHDGGAVRTILVTKGSDIFHSVDALGVVNSHKWPPARHGKLTPLSATAEKKLPCILSSVADKAVGSKTSIESIESNASAMKKLTATNVDAGYIVISADFWDHSVLAFPRTRPLGVQSSWRPLRVADGLGARVTAIMAHQDWFILGGENGLVSVWSISIAPSSAASAAPIGKIAGLLHGHDKPIDCLAVDATLRLVVSCSGGKCILHDLFSGVLIRTILVDRQSTSARIHACVLSVDANIVLHLLLQNQPWLQAWTVNGVMMASAALSEPLHSLDCSSDGKLLLTASTGHASVRFLHNLQAHSPITLSHESAEAPRIVQMVFSPDGKSALAASEDGCLRMYSLALH